MAASTGLKMVMKSPRNTPIRDHIRKYLEKVNLGEEVLNQKVLIFLMNAIQIDVNSSAPISSICKGEQNTITVVDIKNLIAA